MLPFAEDERLSKHLDGLQPSRPQRQPRQPAPMKATADAGRQSGVVSRLLAGSHVFITPDGSPFGDRSSTVFAHREALRRCGIDSSELRLGSKLKFDVKAARFEGGKPEAFDIVLEAA
jgi:hypothetical protein